MRNVVLFSLGMAVSSTLLSGKTQNKQKPNILLSIADDWGAHAGVYGDKVVKTPVFDKLAKEGVLFQNAYISSPSCAPSRAALLTGQWHWRLEEAANLYGPIPMDDPLYTDLLEEAGYFVGYTRKGWGPGENPGREHNPAGRQYKDFETFLAERPKDKPFCFWFGSQDPHRGYVLNSGAESGIPLDEIEVPAFFPDNAVTRGDIADYYFEVQRFDRETGELIDMVRKAGEYENTIIVMTSDHGMPFPRGKSNIYDSGARVPLVIYWPRHFIGGHTVTDFVSLTDLAPTFLEAAGLKIPEIMTGQSLYPQLTAGKSGRIQNARSFMLFGKERHVPSQPAPDSSGYPCRALRTDQYLLIRNFHPERWPAGTGDYKNALFGEMWYGDCDNGPTKYYMIANKDKDQNHKYLYDLSFAKRPEFELYDIKKDPFQIHNLATKKEYAKVLNKLSKQLNRELKASDDPRVTGDGEKFDHYRYTGWGPQYKDYKNYMQKYNHNKK